MVDLLASGAGKLVAFLVVVGVLVALHETGHFVAAKLVGVRVLVFSLGFGPRLFGGRRGATDYRVSLIPLGGYVRMHGDGADPAELAGTRDEFDRRRTWERLFILGMGPATNVLLAVALGAASLMVGLPVPAWLEQPVAVECVEKGSTAEAAGLRPGDVITAIDGASVASWEQFAERVSIDPGRHVTLSVGRDGVLTAVPAIVDREPDHGSGVFGVHPYLSVEVASVFTNGAARAAGFRPGDVIAAIDGVRPCSSETLVSVVEGSGGRELAFDVARGTEHLVIRVTPRMSKAEGKYRIGLGPRDSAGTLTLRRLGLLAALDESFRTNWRRAPLLLTSVARLVTGGLSARAMSGPLEMADLAQSTAQQGLGTLFDFMALVSLNLGLLNLLPVPLLDGGRMAVIGVEAVRGRALSSRTKDWILQAGLVMIVALMAVVLYFDLVKKLGG